MGQAKKILIQGTNKTLGALRKGIKSGHKISMPKIKKTMHLKSPLMREKANLGQTVRKLISSKKHG